jgi:hypothetical protein
LNIGEVGPFFTFQSSHGGGFGTAFRMDRMFVHLCFKLQDEMISQDAGCGQVPYQLLFPDLIP